ncbi:DUF1611 domain-containing protein [Blastopirellula marina]|uniref:DUF1611 domain-containing protein n=1 Tax=Blastopirellula marina TaxID=124 RepID=A0A2S8G9F5_9BACT|nr:DUF1611 domain-containing protein [Blastopirellula marina]PQO41095.1 DUF1611 domain-containing protein [Blastopirellula marina]PTL45971.1 DUF1611 domain-containing protein [Blastopirellula marina]
MAPLPSHSAPPDVAPTASDSVANNYAQHRRIVLLTDGYSNAFVAKTAISLLRYRTSDIVAVLAGSSEAKTAQELLGAGGDIPVVASLDEVVDADAIYVGIAPPGGKLPESWRPILLEAISRGIDIISGLHDFITEDPEYRAAAATSGVNLWDVRKNRFKSVATGKPFRSDCLRILTVGHDCSVGKMVVSLEVQRALKEEGLNAAFLATGQTGIMISGRGIPVDCVVSDFVNGAVEWFVRENEQHDIQLIEGQGSISHPSFSAVTLGLLHGAAPQGLIYCYEAGRQEVKGLSGIPIPSHRELLRAYEVAGNLRAPCRIIGIAVNTRNLSSEEADDELTRIRREFQLPVCDVYRTGAQPLVEAIHKLREAIVGT